MFYAPAPGLRVRDPRTRQLIPAEGIAVGPHDLDLQRMIAQGDLVPAPSAPASPAPADSLKV